MAKRTRVQHIGMVPRAITLAVAAMAVHYGSDCSGMDGAAFGLQYNDVNFAHRFGCEVDNAFRKVFQVLHPTCIETFPDITARDFEDFKRFVGVNVYTAGFPCQPFSAAGLGLGQHDEAGRGLVVWWVITTIATILPWVFVLENVSALAVFKKHREFFEAILSSLRGISGGLYDVEWKILDSRVHGTSAASRTRVYIVGIRRDKKRRHWQWPEARDAVTLDALQLPHKAVPAESQIASLTRSQLKHLDEGLRKILQNQPDTDLTTSPWVIDIGGGPNFSTGIYYNHLPTITKQRASLGFWIVKLDRFSTEAEHLKCQGFKLKDIVVPTDVCRSKFQQMIGNAYTVSVFQRLWRQLLPAVGLS